MQITPYLKLLQKHKPRRKLKILIANDDPYQILILSTLLKAHTDVELVDTAINGQEALDFVINMKGDFDNFRYYDMIFLDLGMPIMDGYDACKSIKQLY